jgi:hypothetical protein
MEIVPVVPSDFAVILVGRNPIFLNSFGKSIVVVPSLANASIDHTIEPPVDEVAVVSCVMEDSVTLLGRIKLEVFNIVSNTIFNSASTVVLIFKEFKRERHQRHDG